jgi:tetratricopeptide (TPR) repeat protein
MPKQRRPAPSRGSARTAVSRAPAKRAATSRAPSRAAVSRATSKVKPKSPSRAGAAAVVRPSLVVSEPAPPPPPRKPAFYEALALYESGVRALQRHDFQSGADGFRGVIQRYPDERELVERARLYLQVCEREHAKRPATPQTAAEAVYAATVALNAGNQEAAIAHLRRALEASPDSDHAHYIMAVALTDKGDSATALRHLQRAITLNPDNRSNAIQDPDLGALRDLPAFRDMLGGLSAEDLAAGRRRVRSRR